MYRGVKFGEYHTAADWGMLLNEKTIDPPKPKTKIVKIDGRDGDIDLTEALGGVVRYESRKLSFKFLLIDGTYTERNQIISEVMAHVHGKRLNILLDDDQDYYFVGRCEVKDHTNNASMGEIEIEVESDPYRLKVVDTVRTVSVVGDSLDVVVQNLGAKTVVPEIAVIGEVDLTFDEITNHLTDGVYKINSIKFASGLNYVKVSGTGDVVFTFREARF